MRSRRSSIPNSVHLTLFFIIAFLALATEQTGLDQPFQDRDNRVREAWSRHFKRFGPGPRRLGMGLPTPVLRRQRLTSSNLGAQHPFLDQQQQQQQYRPAPPGIENFKPRFLRRRADESEAMFAERQARFQATLRRIEQMRNGSSFLYRRTPFGPKLIDTRPSPPSFPSTHDEMVSLNPPMVDSNPQSAPAPIQINNEQGSPSPHLRGEATRNETGETYEVFRRLPEVCRSNERLMAALRRFRDSHFPDTIAYACHGVWCGGLGDRLKGTVSAFLIALLTDRSFGIQHDVPEKLSRFYQPTSFVNWERFDIPGHHQVHFIDNPPGAGHDVITGWPRSLFLFTNLDLVAYIRSIPLYRQKMAEMGMGENCEDMSCMYGCFFPLIFELAPPLAAQYRAILAQHPSFVSIQVRVGREGTSWDDPVRMSIPVSHRFLKYVANHTDPTDHLFLTTDSEQMVTYAKGLFRDRVLFTTEGAIIHIDRHISVEKHPALMKMYLDHYLIAAAKFAFVTGSGFGYVAVWRTRIDCILMGMEDQQLRIWNRTYSLFPNQLRSWNDEKGPLIPA